ncbi:hypothetical protein ES705_37651 [subsurface metagenome]
MAHFLFLKIYSKGLKELNIKSVESAFGSYSPYLVPCYFYFKG